MIHHVPSEIVQPLLAWYDSSARVLPWRNENTPYRVWISEIMLQQTRVDTGLPYFERFVAALPTVQALAEADEQVLLKLWEGLGYYNRVRNLQKAARIVMENYGGQIPGTAEELEKLPGIGAYTAGAISSIAFQYKAPAVDGNVLRVLSRITGFDQDVMASGVKEKTADSLRRILPDRVGDFNQALMELGALICLPNGAPKCLMCPVRELCTAHRQGNELELPVKPEKKARRSEKRTILLPICEGKIALHKREAGGLLAELWEYPSLEGALLPEQVKAELCKTGLVVQEITFAAKAKHIFSHIEWHMTGYYVHCSRDSAPADWVWVTPQQLAEEYPVPSAFRAYTSLLV